MKRYPQLRAATSRPLIEELRMLSCVEAAKRSASAHESAVYTPLGDARIEESELVSLRQALVQAAESVDYPVSPDRSRAKAADLALMRVVSSGIKMSSHEAAHPGVWEFLTCVLAPDIVVWRFAKDGGVSTDRFRAGRRNVFERLWKRWQVFDGVLSPQRAQSILGSLSEDEIVQVMERPSLLGHRKLIIELAEQTAKSSVRAEVGRELLRDVQKRALRRSTLTAIDSLDEIPLAALTRQLVGDSERALT